MEINEYQEREIDLLELAKFLKGKLLYIIVGAILFAFVGLGYEYFVQKNKDIEMEKEGYLAINKIFAGLNEEGVGINLDRDAVLIVTGNNVLDSVMSESSDEIEYETLIENLDVSLVGSRIFQVSYFSKNEQEATEMVQLITESTISYMKEMVSSTEYKIIDSTVEKYEGEEIQAGRKLVKSGMIGAVLGAFFIVVIWVIFYLLNSGLKSKQETEQILKLPVLAEIKGQVSEEKNANAIRILTSLLYAKKTSVLGITSCMKQEGKSAIANAIEQECKKRGIKAVKCNEQTSEKIEELKKNFDLVILDIPELESNPNTFMIMKKCDFLLLVIRKNKTSLKTIQECLRNVCIVGGKVEGLVLVDEENRKVKDKK